MSQFPDNNDYGALTMRYPLKAPVAKGELFQDDDATGATGRTDYVKIRRVRISYKDGGRQYYGSNPLLPDSKSEIQRHKSAVYLAIPPSLTAAYQPVYRQVNLGVGGAGAISMLQSGGNSFEDLAGSIQAAAAAVLPEFAASAIAQGSNAISGFFGVQGNLDANALAGLTQGKVFNPYTEQIFSQMNFRSHSFAFKMVARNYEEAKMIHQIIRYLKMGAHPKVTGGNLNDFLKKTGNDEERKKVGQEPNKYRDTTNKKVSDIIGNSNTNTRFFQVPDHFDIEMLRLNPDKNEFPDEGPEPLHYRIQKCVCSGINVNYTPDGQYTSFKNIAGGMIHVPAVILQLNFTEVKLLDQSDIAGGY